MVDRHFTPPIGLDHLLSQHSSLWRGSAYAGANARQSSLSSGYPLLDKVLPLGGWPAGVIWLECTAYGCGELQLFRHAMASVSQAGRHIVLLDPPFMPCLSAVDGLSLSSVYLMQTSSLKQRLWVADAALGHNLCGLLLLWCDDVAKWQSGWLRRLQVKARQRGHHVVIYNTGTTAINTGLTWASLYMQLCPLAAGLLRITLCKAPGLLRPRSVELPWALPGQVAL